MPKPLDFLQDYLTIVEGKDLEIIAPKLDLESSSSESQEEEEMVVEKIKGFDSEELTRLRTIEAENKALQEAKWTEADDSVAREEFEKAAKIDLPESLNAIFENLKTIILNNKMSRKTLEIVYM